jgi:uncharacterized protein YdiU (UPF0061 family)
LANAIYPVLEEKEALQEILGEYNDTFQAGWNSMMASKIGLEEFKPDTDDDLIGDLIETLQLVETDMTIFFRNLPNVFTSGESPQHVDPISPIIDAYYIEDAIKGEPRRRMTNWLQKYTNRLKTDGQTAEERARKMNLVNPKYVLRNYLAQLAIDKAEKGDFSLVGEILELLRNPYSEQPEKQEYFAKRPEWARNKPGSSMLSCSS